MISKFVKKVEVSKERVTVHYYVGEDHFKRELALHSSHSFSENLGSNRLTSGGPNVDFTETMLEELGTIANELNISRQAVIKTYLRQALDQHYIAKSKVG